MRSIILLSILAVTSAQINDRDIRLGGWLDRQIDYNHHREDADTLAHAPGGWNSQFIQDPGDAMLVVYEMPTDCIIKGVNVPVNEWGTGDQQLIISLHRVSYPYRTDCLRFSNTVVDGAGWIGGYDMDSTGRMGFMGTTYSPAGTVGICDTSDTVATGAQDPLGFEPALSGPPNVPLIGLAWPTDSTVATLDPINHSDIVSGGGDNWINTVDYGGEPIYLSGNYVGILVYSSGAGGGDAPETGFQYQAGGPLGLNNPWTSLKFYGSTEPDGLCRGTSGNDGWHIRNWIFRFELAVLLIGDRGPTIGDEETLVTTISPDAVDYWIDVYDDNPSGGPAGIASVVLHYQLDSTTAVVNDVAMTATGDRYSASIPGQVAGTMVYYWVEATDVNGNATTTAKKSYNIFLVTPGKSLFFINTDFDSYGIIPNLPYLYYEWGTDVFDIWDAGYGNITTDLVTNYDVIVEITSQGGGPVYNTDAVLQPWFATGGKVYIVEGDEWLGARYGWWGDMAIPSGDFAEDIGITHYYPDINAGGDISRLFPVAGDEVGGPMATFLTDSSAVLDYDPEYDPGHANWLDGIDAGLGAIVAFEGHDGQVDPATGNDDGTTLYTTAIYGTYGTSKAAYFGFDIISLYARDYSTNPTTDYWVGAWDYGNYHVSPVRIFMDWAMFGTDSITLIVVPDDQPTIQAGIDFADPGDTVLVMPGIYVENINFNGKNIIVGSLTFTTGDTSYIKQTIIDGNQNGRVITFVSGEDSTAQLCGFTIINGSYTWPIMGGGIGCIGSSPTLRDLIISDNIASVGGGIFFNSSNSRIANCRIMDNISEFQDPGEGGGIYAFESDLLLENLVITNNSGGILSLLSKLKIKSSTFVNTDTFDLSIIYCIDSSEIHLTNSILWNPGVREIELNGSDLQLTVSHCNIEGGLDSITLGNNTVNWLDGNIDTDPLYADLENGFYQLMTCSPCIGAGSNDSIPALDIDGIPRPDPPGSQADMGAHEHILAVPMDIPEIQVTQSSLDFDEAYINFPDTLIYRVSNWGCDILYIFAETDLVEYVVEPNFFALEQGEKDSFLVILTPIYCSSYPDSLILTTNDLDESTIIVPLAGQGVLPPNISVYPYQYDLEMNLDLLETHTSVISNTGGSDLEFEIAMDDSLQQGGYALQFDGIDDYIDCGDLGFTSSSDSITVAMWINPDTLMGDYGYWEFTGASAQFFLSIHDGSYHMGIAGQYFEYHANPAGEWANLAVTFDGLEHSFYLNGELQGSNQVTYPVFFDLFYRPFWIGFGGFPAFAAGTIDAVMVWSTVRSQAQINSDMHRTVAYDEPGLVGYWRFNEGIGDTTQSYTVNNHTGTFHGNPQWVESTAPITSWITVQPLSGIIESSGSEDISITLDARNLLVGDYQTEIQLLSNDPDQGLITIPVSLITVVSVVEELVIPTVFRLHQNYPNPFNPLTTIRYDLPVDSRIKLTIYDILGREVIVLADDLQNAGYKAIRWDGRNSLGQLVSAGMYFYQIRASEYVQTQKMVLLK